MPPRHLVRDIYECAAAMSAPLLVFGWGNRSRGDDSLGPLFVEEMRRQAGADAAVRVEFLDDFQLQIEHAMDLAERERVLFVDASRTAAAPFEAVAVRAARDLSYTTHAMSPQAVLQVFADFYQRPPPPCTLLAIRGDQFELGTSPSAAALGNLRLALAWGSLWLAGEGEEDRVLLEPQHARA